MGKPKKSSLDSIKIPSKIKIRGRTYYQVVFQEIIRDDPACMGLAEPSERMIYLKIGMSQTDQVKTLIHEVIHAIEFEWNQPIPHKITETLEEGIFKVLKLNRFL